LAHFVPNSRLIKQGRGIAISEVTDGLSNTVLDGSIGAAFPAWGDPGNPRDPANGFAGGSNAFGGLKYGALIGFADGSVRFVSSKMDAKTARRIATPGGDAGGYIGTTQLKEAAAGDGGETDADDAKPSE
jgi:hypothetical protein